MDQNSRSSGINFSSLLFFGITLAYIEMGISVFSQRRYKVLINPETGQIVTVGKGKARPVQVRPNKNPKREGPESSTNSKIVVV